jgi:hypothetical protein
VTRSVRVQVTATAEADGWRFMLWCPEGKWSASRSVPAFPEAPRYPRPRLPCLTGCSHELCSESTSLAVDDTLDRLARRDTNGEQVGRYLFDTLLAAHWADLIALAQRLEYDVIELALTWPYQDEGGTSTSSLTWAGLSQLPWELMRDSSNHYLAGAGDSVSVAVTRVVANTTQQAREFSVPPRVLFVVGTRLTDPSVRAGAEMLGLLREVRTAGCRIRHRILESASPRRLREAISAFQPDIVHFISHGELDAEGHGQIKLEADKTDQDWWSAEKLLENLRVGKQLPSVVVLSACDSAGQAIVGSRLAAPLAAELVHGGVPVVVAMAGTVSDRACRVFTRYFGRALAAGESLVVATAEARRLAFAETSSAGADWALPAVFFSAAVQPATMRRPDDPTAENIDKLIRRANLDETPVFCARETFLQVFWAMLGDADGPTGWEVMPGKRPSALVVCVPTGQNGVGKTRLLHELAREALLNGNLPLVIGTGGDAPAPTDVRDLGRELAGEMDWFGRRVLEISAAFGTALNQMLKRDPTDVQGPDSVGELAERLEEDSDQLRRAAATKYPQLFASPPKVVLLIDDLGESSVPLLTKLFDRKYGLNQYGLGSTDHPVPVVLVVLTDDRPGIRRDLLTGAKSEDWLVSRELKLFDQQGEDMLAYELVLLNPFRSGGTWQTQQQWIFNRDPDMQDKNAGHARDSLEGKPAYFNDIRFDKFVQAGVRFEVLAPADDDDVPTRIVR